MGYFKFLLKWTFLSDGYPSGYSLTVLQFITGTSQCEAKIIFYEGVSRKSLYIEISKAIIF